METSKSNDNNNDATEFKIFAAKRVVAGILLAAAALWVVFTVFEFFEQPAVVEVARQHDTDITKKEASHKPDAQAPHKQPEIAKHAPVKAKTDHKEDTAGHKPDTQPLQKQPETAKHAPVKAKTDYKEDTAGRIMSTDFIAMGEDTPAGEVITVLKKEHADTKQSLQVYVVDPHDKLVGMVSLKQLILANTDTPLKDLMSRQINSVSADSSQKKAAEIMTREKIKALPVVNTGQELVGIVVSEDIVTLAQHEPVEDVHKKPEPAQTAHEKPEAHKPAPSAATHGAATPTAEKDRPKGVAFVEATIKPLSYELHDRFWGWRPNDILDFTDNINNFQLGVLEVTRRTVVILTERISRTGSTAAFDKNLERAMNWLMIKSDLYWFPSPESKYDAALGELEIYKEKLEKGEANFHTRTDNLIPLLMAYEDLLGSCEENLIKNEEDDGTPVSFFKSDDYFFYAVGVASAMSTILEAILEDFHTVVESRRGLEVLHHAIESSHHAIEIKPWVITNSSPSGILANHRANMAAQISHARFYVGVLIKTLST